MLCAPRVSNSKKIFASGALVGAKWLLDKPYGLYNMEDVLFKNNA